jgi:segregation and condensation protein B
LITFSFTIRISLDNLVIYIESLIFAADQPITRNDVRYALENCFETKITPEEIDSAIEQLIEKYSAETFAIEVNEIGGGLQFMTKPAFHHVVGSHLKLITKKRLSRVALETLAIIAYKQPVTKTELEKIRGVSCDYAIQKLLEKELVMIEGRAEGPGRPLMYSTTPKFMDYLGLRDIKDLPKLRELEQSENSIGESAPVEMIESIDSTEGLSRDGWAAEGLSKEELSEKGLSENGRTRESESPEMQPSGSDVVSDVDDGDVLNRDDDMRAQAVIDDSEE